MHGSFFRNVILGIEWTGVFFCLCGIDLELVGLRLWHFWEFRVDMSFWHFLDFGI